MIPIVIPSHKRESTVTTTSVVENGIICIPENQYELYKEHNPDCEILTHPNNIIGISSKRQWIYEKFGDVMMLDDDIIRLQQVYLPPNTKLKRFTPKEVTAIINDNYQLGKDIGVKLFGFAKTINPMGFQAAKPIRMNSFIQGAALGLIKSEKLYFPDIPSMIGEDEFIVLLNAYHYRKMFVDKRFFFVYKTNNKNIGGCQDIRNAESAYNSYKILRETFGESVKYEIKNGELLWRTKIPF